MADWGVSALTLKLLRLLLGEKPVDVGLNLTERRGALRTILRELNVWDRYTDECETHIHAICRRLIFAIILFFVGAILALIVI